MGFDDEVCLADYSMEWTAWFEEEQQVIWNEGIPGLIAVEHIGSTAVPGLRAKPIVDIAVMVSGPESGEDVIDALVSSGYRAMGEFGLQGRQFFRKGDPTRYHLHVVSRGHPLWDEWIHFRDALRSDPGIRDAYKQLKAGLATRFASDRAGYTEAKAGFIASVLARVRTSKGDEPDTRR